MAKKIVEDIKIKKNRITQIFPKDIKLNGTPSFKEENISRNIITENNYYQPKRRLHRTPNTRINDYGTRRILIIVFLISVLIGGVYWISNLFLNANITIKAKHQVFNLENREFTASKDLSNPVNYEVMIVPSEESKNIILTQTQDVSIKATGEVTLYNEYSTKDQKLPIHTFLADTNGKTYQTDTAVIIPGYKVDKIANKTIPGSITSKITAFLPGEAYNGNPTDFTITSFKGTTKAKKIYGKAVAPIVGGAQGVVYVLGDDEKNNLDTFASSIFKNNLFKKANALVPPGYILYPNAYNFSYKINNDILSLDPNAKINISGELSTIILKQSDLTNVVVKNLLPDISDNELKEIQAPDISKLSFNFTNKDQIIDKDTQNISFGLTGDLEAIWNPDINTLKNNLLGIQKRNILPIFKQDPGITTASVNIFPPWQAYIPSDSSKINVKVQ